LSLPTTSYTNQKDGDTSGTVTRSVIQIIFGCNGYIWLQRDPESSSTSSDGAKTPSVIPSGGPELVELHQQQQAWHASTPYSVQDRQVLCRLSNCLQVLVTAKQTCTIEHLEKLYHASLTYGPSPARLLHPDVVVDLAARLSK
jgi:hypothetical protein